MALLTARETLPAVTEGPPQEEEQRTDALCPIAPAMLQGNTPHELPLDMYYPEWLSFSTILSGSIHVLSASS